MRTLAVWSIKGGVGKTAAAVNIAHAASLGGTRTLLWDLDPQGAASFYLRVPAQLEGGARIVVDHTTDLGWHARPTEFDNLSLLPADFSFRRLDLELDATKKPRKQIARRLEPLAPRFDLVIMVCPPSVSLVSEAVVRAADAVLVPVIPSTLSIRTLEQIRAFIAEHGHGRTELLPFLSMVDRRKAMHLELCESCLADATFLRTVIPSASVVERMGLTRAPVAATQPSQPVAMAFAALWQEIASKLRVSQ
jgi:cellulose biosynthesis protein BcsQ